MPARALDPRSADSAPAHETASRTQRAVGGVALAGLLICLFLLGANAASGRSNYVPSGSRSFPAWLAGPLAPFGFSTSHALLEGLVLAICALYGVVLACLRALPTRLVWGAIVLATLLAMLAPPLLSGDVMGYISFARLGALHGLSPYSHTANATPSDPIYPYLTWRGASAVTSPYGPLFTIASYALAPLSIAAALWTLKCLAALTTLATVALLWRIAKQLGHSPTWAAAMYGLNPLVLVFAVGGAHNDTWFCLLSAVAILWLISFREPRAGLAMVAATAIKVSAVLLIPFAALGARRRRTVLVWSATAIAIAIVASLAIFGSSLDGIVSALHGEQRDVARHALPNEVSMLLGLGHLPEAVRATFLAGFFAALAATLWRAWKGSWWLDCYAWATLALLGASSWLLPWYGMWALLPASVSGSRRLQGVTLGACAYCVAIKIL
ncbi:MAG: glycosyltransferase 87 family protein [Solirubrobacteraceae bacterium]